MKKFFKISAITLLSIIVLLYIAFLIVPPFINLDKYKSDVQKLVLENSKLNLDYSKIRLYSTPMLSIGAIIENAEVKLDDNTTLFNSPKIRAGIALPSLFTLTIKTAKCLIDSPYINLEIVNDEQYKVVKIIEDIINENNAKPKEEPKEPSNIPEFKIKVPSILITNYLAEVKDLKSAHKLTLAGDKMVLGYSSSSNTFGFKTKAKLFSDDNENINADLKIVATLPKPQPAEDTVDPEEKIKIPFINPVTIYQTYDLKTNVVSRLKFDTTKEDGIYARGFLNIDDLTLKLSDMRLPESYLHSRFHGKKIEYESNIYAKENEKITLMGFLKYDKHPRLKTQIISDDIHFSNLLDLAKGLLDSLNIQNNLSLISAQGHMRANATIKTNFKKLKSEGQIIVENGSFVNQKTGVGIKDLGANFLFDNNALNIKDAKAVINGSKLALEGSINNKSIADIKVDVQNLSLPPLYQAFAPKELKNQYQINSANLTTHADVKGKLENLNAQLKAKLENLSVNDSKKTMFITNKTANVTINADSANIKGDINNTDFLFNMPQMNTKAAINNIKINLTNDKITINPFDLIYNNISKFNIKGEIANYQKDPQINIFASGNFTVDSIKQTLGKEISYYMNSKGAIPLKVSVKGNSKKQDITAQIYSDANNYITPVNLSKVANAPALINLSVNLKGDKIKIKDSGFYKKAQTGFSDDLAANMSKAERLVELTSVIEGSHINLFRLNIPHELDGSVAVFKKSAFKTKGKMVLNGDLDNLSYGGDLKIFDINIPELYTSAKNSDINFTNHGLDFNLKELNLNGSKIDASLKADLRPSKVFKINDINVESNDIDVDKLMVVSNEAMKYMPPASPSASKNNASSQDIPLSANGKFNIKHVKTGNINITDLRGGLGIENNELLISKFNCKAFDGTINGDISMNLLSGLLGIKVKGDKVNADKMLVDAAGMKDTLSGIAKFSTDITLMGATYEEQMKSLKGSVLFNIKNGQYGPFSKLENFFLAENVRENPVFKNTIGIILTPITTIDSSHFENLDGKLDFKNGVVTLNPITSQGDILCILIRGDMNLLKNEIDSKVRVRLASTVSDLLGPLSMANPVNLVKNTPGLNIATAKLFSIFTYVVEPSEYKEIPDFSSKHSDNNATKFQIILEGDVAKPLKLVKSFKWLALQEDMDKAQEFSDKFVKEQEDMAKQALIDKLQSEYEKDNKLKVGLEKVLQMDTTAPKVKEVILEEVLRTKNEASRKAANQIDAKKQELEAKKQEAKDKLETKVQNIVEKNEQIKQQKIQEQQQKIQEQQQKVQEAKDKLKNDIKNKLKTKDIEPTVVESSTTN